MEFYRQALEVCRGYKECESEPELLRNLGFSYQAAGNWQKALENYKEAEPLYVRAGQRDQVAITVDWIGALYRRMGKGPDAVEAFTRLVALRQEPTKELEASLTTKLRRLIHLEAQMVKK